MIGILVHYWEDIKEMLNDKEDIIKRKIDYPFDFTIFVSNVRQLVGFNLQIANEDDLPNCKGLIYKNTPFHITIMSKLSCGDIFFSFVQGFYESTYTLSSSNMVYNKLKEEINRWKHFFEIQQVKSLTKEEEMGLIGELLTIELLNAKGYYNTIAGWVGAEYNEKDFKFGPVDIEVKTILYTKSKIQIHGEKQLMCEENAMLYVLVWTIEEDAGGVSLDDIVKEIESIVGNNELFYSKLMKRGYIPVQNGRKYKIIMHNSYKVTEDFPRIRPQKGITDVYYSISLESIKVFLEDIPVVHS